MASDQGFSGGDSDQETISPWEPARANFGMLSPKPSGPNQIFTEPGTYTWIAPSGVTEVNGLVIGGGGGGGGGSGRTAYAGYYTGGGGGGASKAVYRWLPVTPGNSYTVVVGDGGVKGDPRDGIYSSGSNGGNGSGSSITGFDAFGSSILSGGGFGGANSPTGTGGQSGNVGGGTGAFGSGAFELVTAQSGLNAGSGTTKGGRGAPGYNVNFSTSVALQNLVSFGSYGISYAEGSGQSGSGGTGYGAGGTGGGCVQSDVYNANNMYATDGAPGAVFIWWGYATQKVAANYGGSATPPTPPVDGGVFVPGDGGGGGGGGGGGSEEPRQS
jgi:hypothetical protein